MITYFDVAIVLGSNETCRFLFFNADFSKGSAPCSIYGNSPLRIFSRQIHLYHLDRLLSLLMQKLFRVEVLHDRGLQLYKYQIFSLSFTFLFFFYNDILLIYIQKMLSKKLSLCINIRISFKILLSYQIEIFTNHSFVYVFKLFIK